MADGDLRVLAADLAGAGQKVRAEASTVVRQSGMAVQNHARANAAVDTGFMRSSIQMTTGDLAATITPSAFYSHFVEHGTIYMSAQPFMGPAIDAVEPSFIAAMEQVGGDIL